LKGLHLHTAQSAMPTAGLDMKFFQSFRLDAPNHSLWRGPDRVQITPKAFDILRYMVERAGNLVTQDELLAAIWPETYVNPEVLRKYILEIRKALGDRLDKPIFIETVTKRGYRFVASVTDEQTSVSETLPTPAVTEQPTDSDVVASKQKVSSKWTSRQRFLIPAVLLILTAVTITGFVWRARNRNSTLQSSNNSIAVLPFADMSPGKDQEYFSDGLTEELINNLSRVPRLKVVARSSAFQFKGKNEDPRTVGQKLGVANILEGSVRKEGNRVRITAELTKTGDGFQVWSETYDREVSHIFAAQDEIAHAVTDALQLKLLNSNSPVTSKGSRTSNSDAYQAYLQGEYFIARGQDKDDLDKALSYADQAIKLDPDFAPAWAQRAQVLQTLASVALIENADGFRRARESAEKAIALDPNLATGYMALGLVQTNHDWDWQGATDSLKKAGTLEPGSASVLGNRAYLARNLGRIDDAVALYKQAIALDPLRANFHLALGYVLFLQGRYDEAHAALQRAQELNPQLSSLHLTQGKILFSEGHPQEALVEMEKETGDWEKMSGESLAYYAVGRRADSEAALQRLIATHQNDCAYQIAEVYAFRGETDKAFEWLDRAYRQRDPGTPEFKSNPLMNRIHSDPRSAELLKKLRLPA
jgi:TolB-like protein/DNA-binding winged helix-turn-helix (wHTH) protein/Flp pilus assembly protein TadD